jgi:hypothetical protein
MTIHDRIMAQYRRIDREQAKLHDLQAQQDAEEGDTLGAEWHRLQALAHRERTPENTERAHRAWLVSMAASHLRRGSVPAEGDHEAEAVLAVMDEMRNAELMADHPSHATTPPEPFEVSAR